jgi:RNA polymerase sigma-70 factor (ECF subfamily)
MLETRVSDRVEREGDRDVALDDVERTRWFMHHILPHEAVLRGWLSRRRAPSPHLALASSSAGV